MAYREILHEITQSLKTMMGSGTATITQVQNPRTGNFTKRDTDTGRFVDVKQDGKPFKGVAKEVDGRRK